MNDKMTAEQFHRFLKDAFTTASAFLRPGGAFYIWHADSNGLVFRQAAEEAGLCIKQNLVWNKNHFTLGRQDYQWKHEPCLYGWKPGAAHYFFDSRGEASVLEDKMLDFKKMKKEEMLRLLQEIYADKRATTVLDYDKPTVDGDHPTMKPVKMIGYLMRNSTKKGDTVLDTFGGSGTTMIAAEQLGRRSFLMELDPHYCDVILARWEKLTGKQARKIN